MSYARIADAHQLANILGRALGMTDPGFTDVSMSAGVRDPIRYEIKGIMTTEQARRFMELCGEAEAPAPDVWEHREAEEVD